MAYYEFDERMWERALNKMDKSALEKARDYLKDAKNFGDQNAWAKFLLLVEEFDPGEAREMKARVRR